MNIDIKKISELNEAIYNDNLLFLVEDQDGKGKKFKGVNFKEELKRDLVAKSSMLSFEEIIASTPPIDLDVAIPKASSVKILGDNLNNKKCNFSYFSTGSSSRDFKLNGILSENARIPIIFYITDQQGKFCNYHIAILADIKKIVPFKIAGDMDITASFDFSTQILHLEYSKTGVWGTILFLTIDQFYITET